MFSQIMANTPPWVWALLLALVWLGTSQRVARVTSRGRVVRMSLAMAALSFFGTVSAFGASPLVLACWVAAAGTMGYVVLCIPVTNGTRYLAETRTFELPGSWTPLTLMLGIFSVKYLSGILLAMQAPVVRAALFGPLLGLLYGAFSGVFLGRAGRLLLLAKRS